MSKIICDVCGTRYPDSSEQCPICGCVNNKAGNESAQQRVPAEDFEVPARPGVKGGRFSKANVRKRNQNKPIYDEPEVRAKPAVKKEKAKAKPEPEVREEAYDLEDAFEEENGKKGGAFINVLLVLVIMALLAVSAYLFLQYFMPNFFGGEPIFPNEEPTVQVTEEPTEPEPTDPPIVHCEQLVLDVTDITLYQAGEMHLLNIQALPAGTTDEIMYISSNEDVATINTEGQITAVAEGSVVISAFCGTQHLEVNVICDFDGTPPAANGDAPAVGGEAEAPAETPTEAGETKTVTSKTLNIRSGAGTSYEKVGSYKKGDVVTVYEQQKVGKQYWGRTDDGWVCMDYLK